MYSHTLASSTGLYPCVYSYRYHNLSRQVRNAAIMGHSGDNRTVPAEQYSPPPPNSSGTRRHRHDGQRSRKKQKVISSETETRIRIQTLNPDLSDTFSSYTHRHTNSYVQRQDISRRKSRRTHCQRKWTYSAHDVSNYNGDIQYTHRHCL